MLELGCLLSATPPERTVYKEATVQAQNPNALYRWSEGDFERSREISQCSGVHETFFFAMIRQKGEAAASSSAGIQ